MKNYKTKSLASIVFVMTCLNLSAITYNANDSNKIFHTFDSLYLVAKMNYSPDARTSIFDIKCSTFNNILIITGKTNNIDAITFLKTKLTNNNIEFMDSIKMLPGENLQEKIYAVVNNSVSNHRTKPSNSAELTTQALLGMPLNILDKKTYWYKVQTPDNYIAWVDNGAINLMTKSEINEWLTCKKIVYYKLTGYSYEKPNENSQIVSDLVICNVLKYLGTEGKFILVAYPDGRKAYIKKTECIDYEAWLNMKTPTADDIINTAKRFMGLPYLWGGTSAKALDCSGLTKTTFLIHAVNLQRDASQQVNYGENLSINNSIEKLQKGDLLFFGDKKSDISKGLVTHVALYMGNQKFIHASGSVSVNSFNKTDIDFSQYRLNMFLTSKDYITKIGSKGIEKIKDCELYQIRK
jgi:cell wall-associated NlpC family hydrolase